MIFSLDVLFLQLPTSSAKLRGPLHTWRVVSPDALGKRLLGIEVGHHNLT